MREFNVTGICVPKKHYMVDITSKLEQIKILVDKQKYFTINRGRQYGKTTTLSMLRRFLADDYTVISISFEGIGEEPFSNEESFCQTFMRLISRALRFTSEPTEYRDSWLNPHVKGFETLSEHVTDMCEEKKLVLMIDEVDKASNNIVFLNFLSKLRDKYNAREDERDFTFHSVILAGVYDIKNIKLKMITEGLLVPTVGETGIHNSPWNIAVSFDVDMSFSPAEIMTMLSSYETDHGIGMDINALAQEIHFYSNGYPVLVSKICQYLDEKLKSWEVEDVREAVRLLLSETDNPLFRGISQNLETHKDIYKLLYDVLILGFRRSFSIVNPAIDLAYRYGYIKEYRGSVRVSNRIFETIMADYFISKDEGKDETVLRSGLISEITKDGRFNMQLCLERFLIHWQELYSEKRRKFFERECRLIFLTYLKPLLNGVGFYQIESSLTDDRRMDLVIIYGKERFVLELKTWKGQIYREDGLDQLLGYMDKLNEGKGYLLTFDFRKQKKEQKAGWIDVEGKQIFEAQV